MSLFSAQDIGWFRLDALMCAWRNLFPNVVLSDAYLLRMLHAAEAETSKQLRVLLEPTYVFPFTPADSDIAAIPGNLPWIEEPGYDYSPDFFEGDKWGYLVLRQKPLISVDYIRLSYPAPMGQQFYVIPPDWIRPDKRYSVIRLVPFTASFTAPLGAFIMQALGGGATVPSMIQVGYTAGLKDVKTDPQWADLIDVISKKAALKVIEGAYLPQSGSISGDGLSQSMSLDTSKYRELIQETLFGPKGSNGGLFSYIHGIVGAIAGVTA